LQYIDITEQELKYFGQKYKIIEQQYFVDGNGNKHEIDGRHVVLNPSKMEKKVAELMGKLYGGEIRIVPRINEPEGIKTPDYIINGESFDLKEIHGHSVNTLYNAITRQRKQSSNFIFDISSTELSQEESIRQIKDIYKSKHKSWINKIILIKNNEILIIFKRKNEVDSSTGVPEPTSNN